MEERAAMTAAKDGFSKADGSRSDTVGDGLNSFGSDSDRDEEHNCSRDFWPRMGLRYEKNRRRIST